MNIKPSNNSLKHELKKRVVCSLSFTSSLKFEGLPYNKSDISFSFKSLVSFSLIFSSFSPLTSLDFVPSFSLNLVHSFFRLSQSLTRFLSILSVFSFSLLFFFFSRPLSLKNNCSFIIKILSKTVAKTKMVFQKKKVVLERFLPSFHNLPRKKGSSSFCHLVGSIWSRERSHEVSQSREFFFFKHGWLSVLL